MGKECLLQEAKVQKQFRSIEIWKFDKCVTLLLFIFVSLICLPVVRLRASYSSRHTNIFDNMLCIMEKYATRLEWLVDERTRQLSEEKKKIENLLLRMLPALLRCAQA